MAHFKAIATIDKDDLDKGDAYYTIREELLEQGILNQGRFGNGWGDYFTLVGEVQEVTQEFYGVELLEFVGEDCEPDKFVDVNYDPVSEDFIGTKWAAILDFHV